MLPPIRRIVTGHRDRKGTVIIDGVDAHKIVIPGIGVEDRILWVSDATPADISLERDTASVKAPISPPDGGSIFRIVDFPPLKEDALKPGLIQGIVDGQQGAASPPPKHPMMHRTRTLDYAIVLAGEIDMLLDDTVVRCRAGDVVVQQGTSHGWVNRGKEPCRIAFVMIDAKEPG